MQMGEKMMDSDGGERDLGEVREVQDDGRRWTVAGGWWSRWWRLVMVGCRGEMRDDDGVLREGDGDGEPGVYVGWR